MDTHLIAYDIADPKRLRKVARASEDFGYGNNIQCFSVDYRRPT